VRGTVLEGVGGTYRVLLGDGRIVDAFLRGRLKREARTGDRVVAGDRGEVEPTGDGGWTVERVYERDTELVRAGPGGRRPKVVAANVDRMVVVASRDRPPFRPDQVDRFLVLAEVSGLAPILVVNKRDLPDASGEVDSAVARYRAIGYPVFETQALARVGVDALGDALADGVSVLAGPSGAGKSSLLNALVPGLDLRTREVSVRGGSGRHTTVSARLLPLPSGGWVVDTPGFSEVALWDVDPTELSDAFPEFREPAEECRFRACTHLHEPDCAVRAALDEGAISRARYRSYRRMHEAATA
jgi:ribosome biogenesis GTPase / thiamine phosphate phosphatase